MRVWKHQIQEKTKTFQASAWRSAASILHPVREQEHHECSPDLADPCRCLLMSLTRACDCCVIVV